MHGRILNAASSAQALNVACGQMAVYRHAVLALVVSLPCCLTPIAAQAQAGAPQTVSQGRVPQAIAFELPAEVFTSTPPVTLAATASSGLPVHYTVSGPATLAGNRLSIGGKGAITVVAHQSGNDAYDAAPDVVRIMQVRAIPVQRTSVSSAGWLALLGISLGALVMVLWGKLSERF